ncbi:MAG: cytochrome P450 [Chloroflexota bacterium]|nr:cytochrome P450 [Chloroflexota bacterium]
MTTKARQVRPVDQQDKNLPPGPKGLPLLGSLIPLRSDRIGFLMKCAEEYGDIVHFKVVRDHVFLLNHPDYVQEVLVTNNRNFVKSRGLKRTKAMLGEGLLTSEGAFHLRQRRLVQPAFHRKRIAAYAHAMIDYAARTYVRWEALGDGAVVDMAEEMMRLTLSVVGKTLFDADVEGDAREVGEAMSAALEGFSTLLLPFSEYWEDLPLPSLVRMRAAHARLNEIIYRIIEERRASGEDRGDLLSMLLMARDEEGDGSGMTDEQVRDEAMTLFLAGHETTANALTWTWYLLSEHPEVVAKLHAELDKVLGGDLPGAEDVGRLSYTRMVIAESMRLYPPAWAIGRRALDEFEIGGYRLPAKSTVFVSQYVMHHDPRYWPDPFRFDPERWRPEEEAKRPKYAYFPFGGGPRICVGEHFAWTEAILVLATLAQEWAPRLLPSHPVAMDPLITLRPKHGMKMILERRQREERGEG